MKQDEVNNVNSAFILRNRLISRGFQIGLIGPGGPGGPGVPGVPGVPDGQGGQGGQVVRRSGGPGGQVVWAVKVFMMPRVVQVVQTG